MNLTVHITNYVKTVYILKETKPFKKKACLDISHSCNSL